MKDQCKRFYSVVPMSDGLRPVLMVPLLLTALLMTFCVEVGAQESGPEPVLRGKIKKGYEIDSLMYKEDFEDLDRWVIQAQNEKKTRVKVSNNKLSVYSPAGVTTWFRRKLHGPVAIVYQVRAPKHPNDKSVVPRDINNFWHMTTPDNQGTPLDKSEYTGSFGTYHELHGYYASTGGRSNTSTRFRRYPRQEPDGSSTNHIALTSRDGKDEYLITPGKTHTVQLVAADGTAQYIVDGKLVYAISYGDRVSMKQGKDVTYTRDRFPPYNEGWFGLRQTVTHHIYSNVRVYRLQPK